MWGLFLFSRYSEFVLINLYGGIEVGDIALPPRIVPMMISGSVNLLPQLAPSSLMKPLCTRLQIIEREDNRVKCF